MPRWAADLMREVGELTAKVGNLETVVRFLVATTVGLVLSMLGFLTKEFIYYKTVRNGRNKKK